MRPALAEVAGRDDEDAVARREQVGDCRLHRGRAGGREQEHVALGAVHLAQALERRGEDRAEVGPAVVDDRLRQRREHLRRDGRRPRSHQVPLLGQGS